MVKAGKNKRPGSKISKTSQKKKATQKAASKPVKRVVHEVTKIPGSFYLTKYVLGIFKQNWRVLGGITLIYVLVNSLFANGISNFTSALTSIDDNTGAGSGTVFGALNGFAGLLGGNGSPTGSALQTVLVIIESLVIIWALRHLVAGKPISIKQAYYHSMGPLVPFVIVLSVIVIQLIPLTLGTAALGVVLSSVFTSESLVIILFSILFTILAAWSLYMLTSSVLALYIVTLPDMHPRQALRAAKSLVKSRRWQLMRRLVYVPLFILVVMAAVVLPLAILLPWAAVIAYYLIGALSILFVHTFLYSLYRSLI
ncbi:hypothetical protein H0X09_01540 [Candidatus Saccharibacteria bacterium]|nr:hypothetical protein [Candidatus Saccharibacteria bacterium]